VRTGAKVERRRFDALDRAFDALEAGIAELAGSAAQQPPPVRLRRFAPEDQVVARVELSGPERHLARTHAGVDVRGDGRTEAYLGRVRRRPVEPTREEDAIGALRRALSFSG
jgi:hypothetical protein